MLQLNIENKLIDKVYDALMSIISTSPRSREVVDQSDPIAKSRSIINSAAIKSATFAGTLALPPGPLGMLTVIPDLVAIWRIQNQMVVDIAATFGREATLTQEQMIYCLFKHSAGQVVRDITVRAGERIIIKSLSTQLTNKMMRKVGVKVIHRATGKSLARWMPLIGAIGIGAYAYIDTAEVGKSCIGLFENKLAIELV